MRSSGAISQPINSAFTVAGVIMRTEPVASRRFNYPMAHHLLAAGLWMLTVILFWAPIRSLIQLSLNDERSTHIVVVPFISMLLIWLQRKPIFLEAGYGLRSGMPLFLSGLALWYFPPSSMQSLHLTDQL